MNKVDQLTTEVNLLRTDVTSLTNLITKSVIPGVLTAGRCPRRSRKSHRCHCGGIGVGYGD